MIHELKIIPIPDPRLVPKYLLEQIKEREWEIEDWYRFQMELRSDETNKLLGIVDKNHNIVGIIWLDIDFFNKMIFIYALSVDKKYQLKSKLIKFVSRYIKEIAKNLKIPRVIWISKRPKAYERYGFKESESKIMEAYAWQAQNQK